MTNSTLPATENASAIRETRIDEDTQKKLALDSEAQQEMDSRPEETSEVIANGPKAGNRAGALAFLALVVVIAAAVHFYMADSGGAYLKRLDADLLQHAELSLKAGGKTAALSIAPSWPPRMYEKIRKDIALYAAAAAAAAYLWQLSARSRARRDAFLLHDKLNNEIAALRQRVALLEDGARKRISERADRADRA